MCVSSTKIEHGFVWDGTFNKKLDPVSNKMQHIFKQSTFYCSAMIRNLEEKTFLK